MEILRDRDVTFSPQTAVYRETGWMSLVMGIVLLLVVAGAGVYVAGPTGASSLWADIGFLIWAAIMALPTLLAFRTFLASRRPESWLIAWANDRLYIRFRSYQNFRFDPDTPSVVCIPRREVAWIRPHAHSLETQDGDGNWNGFIKVKGLQIKLRPGTESTPLSEALSEEAKMRSPKGSRFNHYPVTLGTDGILRVELRRPNAVLTQIARFYPTRAGTDIPLTHFQDMTAAEKESHILDLILAGRKMDAIKAAREVYGFDIADAKRMVDGLAES